MWHKSKSRTVLLKKSTLDFLRTSTLKIAKYECLKCIQQQSLHQIVLLDSNLTDARIISNDSESQSCIVEVPNTSKKLFNTHVITCSAASIERSKRRRNKSVLQHNIPTVAFKSNCKGEWLIDAPD
ncbi:hypothetical protein CAP35_06475 [Chitinophagaceae bacterium IBVUCB1]|nr:hypothetical protein CAP35_06475 [Chitinophagaceae bacterium IBVUCB1]